jgi:ATP-dependent DNA helicase RecG
MIENQDIEFKTSWRDDYLKWVCGFANAKGGKLFIGINDKGEISGIRDYKKLADDIPNKIISHLGVVCEINVQEKNGAFYIEIIVPPYEVPISFNGKYYFRTGTTLQELRGFALNEFLQAKAGKTWDDTYETEASLDDIDLIAIRSFKEGASSSQRLPHAKKETDLSKLLTNLRLMHRDKLKRAAVLLFGLDPQKYYLTSYLKIGRFGNSDADLLSQELIDGNIFTMADNAMEILDKKYFKKLISYQGLQRLETPEYPYEAVREILLNAIVHRHYAGPPIQVSVYDDRFMVWNYGTLPNTLTIEDLMRKHASHPRNQLIADVFFKGGLIEAWGRGTIKIMDECKKAKLPKPDIEEMTGGICVTLYNNWRSFLSRFNLNERQIRAMEYLDKQETITNKDYQQLTGISRETASRDLADLKEKKLIESSGLRGIGSYYYRL